MNMDDLAWVQGHERVLHPFPWSIGNFRDALEAGYIARIMGLEGEDLGYAVLLTVLDEAHLLNISIVRERHGQGLGSAFLDALCDEIRARGAAQMFLEVRPSNETARRLYETYGFVPIGRRKRYYPAVDGGREDAIVMRLGL
jgi:ribosomal-protein-alanine N-acetyltransferase